MWPPKWLGAGVRSGRVRHLLPYLMIEPRPPTRGSEATRRIFLNQARNAVAGCSTPCRIVGPNDQSSAEIRTRRQGPRRLPATNRMHRQSGHSSTRVMIPVLRTRPGVRSFGLAERMGLTSGAMDEKKPTSAPDSDPRQAEQPSARRGRPDTSYQGMSQRAPGRDLTLEEFGALVAPHLLPPDAEG